MTPAEAARVKLNTALDEEATALRRAGDAAEVFGATSLEARTAVRVFERARAFSNEADRELRVILGRYSGR